MIQLPTQSVGLIYPTISPTTRFLTTTTLIYDIGDGILTDDGARLSL